MTVTAFLLGATAARRGRRRRARSARLGLAGLSSNARLAVLLAALADAIVLDALLPRRSRVHAGRSTSAGSTEYRGWVYGLGYGAQLGLA